ncbi:hypothetical protein AX16_008350 [Volvariella volvacea WC 439]|nr:hypothetical protein AX16_008350 [Volvariella volvacea WC 439]
MLQQRREEEDISPERNPYKVRSYSNAIKVIGGLGYPLRLATQTLALPGIGVGLTRRIIEYLDQQGEYAAGLSPAIAEEDKKKRIELELTTLPGIGAVKAKRLVDAGCRSIDDLRLYKYRHLLSKNWKIQLGFQKQLPKHMTREDAEVAHEVLESYLSSQFEILLVDEYRRGLPNLKKLRFLLLHPDHVHVPFPSDVPTQISSRRNKRTVTFFGGALIGKGSNILYTNVINHLEKRGVIAATSMSRERKWRGIIRIPAQGEPLWERLEGCQKKEGNFKHVEIYLAPQKSRAAALLMLTGNRPFIRDLMVKASKRGLYLNEYGLWRWNPIQPIDDAEDPSRVEEGYWELLKTDVEEAIFTELGVEWIDPEKRNSKFLNRNKDRRRP